MLSITRKINEMLQIGEDLTVKVVSIGDGQMELLVVSEKEETTHHVAECEKVEIVPGVSVLTKILSHYRVRLGIVAPRNMVIYRLPRERDDEKEL